MHSGHYIVRCNGSLRELTEELPEYRNALDRELLAKHPLLQNESILSNDQKYIKRKDGSLWKRST